MLAATKIFSRKMLQKTAVYNRLLKPITVRSVLEVSSAALTKLHVFRSVIRNSLMSFAGEGRLGIHESFLSSHRLSMDRSME